MDGTHGVDLNQRIRQRDHQPCPGAPELKAVLRHIARTGRVWVDAALDVSDAHSQIPVQEQGWH